LWVPFVLINAGCLLRVTAQTLTDFTPAAFPVAGVSGLLEVAGLAVWGTHLWRIMAGRAVTRPGAGGYTPVAEGAPLVAANRVGEVLDHHPELLPVFLAHGFTPLGNAVLRKTVAQGVTLATACRLTGRDVAAFLAALNAARRKRPAGSKALPVLPPDEGACCPSCAGSARSSGEGSS
jgi:hypothetical protein